MSRDKEYPITLVEANHKIEYFKLIKMQKYKRSSTQYSQDSIVKPVESKGNGEVDGSQYFSNRKKFLSF